MKFLISFLAAIIALTSYSQTPTELANPILEEGYRLYRSEMASWHGTDMFLEKYSDRENIGGYFSYEEEDSVTCIFYGRKDESKIIGTITFEKTFNKDLASISLKERDFTDLEKEYYTIRKKAWERIMNDSMFLFYQNTGYNPIPLIIDGQKKVYILTAPKNTGVIIFGNDYLIEFDDKNEITSAKPLHMNIIPMEYGNEEEDTKSTNKKSKSKKKKSKNKKEDEVVGTMHNHSERTGDFITPTDICTLMLYAKYAKWEQHVVVSKKYMNIWNCKTNTLIVIPNDNTFDNPDKNKK